MRTEVNINANMLTWAIARAGYELHDFTDKTPKILSWIEGTKKPTVKQLEDFSKKVHLPFGYFFLKEPPKENLPFPFFRNNNLQTTNKVNVNVYDTILLVQKRQEWLRDYLTSREFDELPFVGKFKGKSDVKEIVLDIRKTLGLKENWANEFPTWEKALDYLTTKIEDNGIIMIFNGVVENNTSRPIKVDDCRGFVIVDSIAPFMFINNADGKAAQMFTIVHELAHIWTGHSAGFDFDNLQPADDPIEKLCDKIAAEFLVPEYSFNEIWRQNPKIKTVAKYFKVSEIVIARRALDTNKITKKDFLNFYEEYKNQIFFKKETQGGGGDFYATAKKRISITFAAHINNAVKSGNLLYRDAYKLTSLKGDTFQNFFSKHFNRNGNFYH